MFPLSAVENVLEMGTSERRDIGFFAGAAAAAGGAGCFTSLCACVGKIDFCGVRDCATFGDSGITLSCGESMIDAAAGSRYRAGVRGTG
jgi:hypothetical protein